MRRKGNNDPQQVCRMSAGKAIVLTRSHWSLAHDGCDLERPRMQGKNAYNEDDGGHSMIASSFDREAWQFRQPKSELS